MFLLVWPHQQIPQIGNFSFKRYILVLQRFPPFSFCFEAILHAEYELLIVVHAVRGEAVYGLRLFFVIGADSLSIDAFPLGCHVLGVA
jgi:hypothetical protein